jgi:putative flippase GtrA
MELRRMVVAGIGGAAATAVDVATLVLLVHRGVPVALAAFVASAAGAVVGFTANKYVAFRDRSRVSWQQLGRFSIVALATAMLMAAAMELFAVKLGVPYVLAKLLCAGLVFVAWTYPAQRRLVFHRRPSASMSFS